jgi:hypothetical protein
VRTQAEAGLPYEGDNWSLNSPRGSGAESNGRGDSGALAWLDSKARRPWTVQGDEGEWLDITGEKT